MEVKRLIVGQLAANCYLAWNGQAGVVIDPGGDGDYISEEVLRTGMKLKAILLTHAHFDHVLGVMEMRLNFKAPVYLHNKDEFLYRQAGKSSRHWTGVGGEVPQLDEFFVEGQLIEFGENGFRVLETPGHTPGSVCFYEEKAGVLFSGDTLFEDGIGRTDFSYSDWLAMRTSLQRLLALPGETLIYPGHGESTRIDLVDREVTNL